ncbi:MAG: glycosyl hydrolase family 28 protein [Terriglobia bacterium]
MISKQCNKLGVATTGLIAMFAFAAPGITPPNRQPSPKHTSVAAKVGHILSGTLLDSGNARQENAGIEVRPDKIGPEVTSSNVCDVRAFGAKGDGAHVDTASIQSAIRACANRGGGIVRFVTGTYLSGSIQLESNITLRLEQGAHVLGSNDVGLYTSIGRAAENRSTALVWAISAQNVGITGPGVIDGNGRAFISETKPHGGAQFYDPKLTRQGAEVFSRYEQNREGPVGMLPRPGVLVLFIQCENVDLHGFNVVDAPNWCIHLACCRHAVISGLNVRNSLLVPNADAIDLANSRDVHISDVYLEAGDDGIAISPCAIGYCSQTAENITVSNAVIVSRSAGIRIGWSSNDIRNLVFTNIIIRDSNRGIAIFVRGKEKIENVLMSNIILETRLIDGSWWGMGEPVHVSVAPWNVRGELGSVTNLRFVNVTATSQGPVLLYAERPGLIRDVLFDDFNLNISSGPLTPLFGGNLDLRPVSPMERGITRYDVAGVKAENVEGLTLRNFSLHWKSAMPAFFRAGIEIAGFRDATIDGFAGSGPSDGTPAIWLHNGVGATVTGARATSGRLLSYEGVTDLTLDSKAGTK